MTSYSEALEYLYRLKNRGVKLNLDRVYTFQELLGYPDREYDTVHVAGTNGKGSVVHYLSAMLRTETGRRVGTYTSPHLLRFNERVSVNHESLPDQWIVRFLSEWREELDRLQLTYFEATTMMAFAYFQDQDVDIAVLETGLGGRLDATNIVNPLATVITSIGYEHTEQLGETLPEIAREKAGIMKRGVPCVVGKVSPEVETELGKQAKEKECPLIYALSEYDPSNVELTESGTRFQLDAEGRTYEIALKMLGEQVVHNATIALRASESIRGYNIPWGEKLHALQKVTIPGRLERLSEQPLVYYDVAHNYDGLRQLVDNLARVYPERQIRYLFGIGVQKDIGGLPPLFSDAEEVGVMHSEELDMHSLEEWEQLFPEKRVRFYGQGEPAVRKFCQSLQPEDLAVIAGSHYIADAVYSGIHFLLDT